MWKILQISGAHDGGQWFIDQVLELQRRKHLVEVVVPAEGTISRRLREADCSVMVIPFRGYHPRDVVRLARAQMAITRTVHSGRYDIVHAHLLKTIISTRLAVRGPGRAPALVSQVPGVVHLQNRWLRGIDRMTMRRDSALVGSCTEFARVYRLMGARQVYVNHYGCHTDLFDPDTPRGTFRAEQRLDDGTLAVGMLAHMYPTRFKAYQTTGVKGHETFIDAANLLVRQGCTARFFIVGDEFVGDGSYRRRLQQRARTLGLDESLIFLGHRSDVANVLAGLDIMVNPSLSESASYTMIEASLMRKPVVATRVGGLPDTVLDGVTGILVAPNSPDALAAAVQTLIEDPRRRAAFGEAGREHVRLTFDVVHTVDKLEDIYADVVAA